MPVNLAAALPMRKPDCKVAEIAKSHRWDQNQTRHSSRGRVFRPASVAHVYKCSQACGIWLHPRSSAPGKNKPQTRRRRRKALDPETPRSYLHRHPSFVFTSQQLRAFICLERCRLAAAHTERRRDARKASCSALMQMWSRACHKDRG